MGMRDGKFLSIPDDTKNCSHAGHHMTALPPTGNFKCHGQELNVIATDVPRFRRCIKCGTVYWLRPTDQLGASELEKVSAEGLDNLRRAFIIR